MELEFAFASASRNDVSFLKIMVSNGADLNRAYEKYNLSTPLHIAAEYGSKEVVQYLGEIGVDLDVFNGSSLSPLMIAVFKGNYEVANILLELGAKINIKNKVNYSGLFLATANGYLDAIDFFLKNKADMYTTGGFHGDMAMHIYIGNMLNNNIAIDINVIKLYLENGYDPNYKDEYGYQLIHSLAMQNNVEVVKLLEKYDIDYNAIADLEITPLWISGMSNSLETLSYLIGKGARIDYKISNGKTILMWAVQNNQTDLVKRLVELGASLSCKDIEGKTAIDYASEDMKEYLQ